jgi:molecular chaperone HtpG
VLGEQKKLKIDILSDKENKCISIKDEGIETTTVQLILNLNKILRSETRQFMQAIEEETDLLLIVQFYVGFFAAFLVADRFVAT